MKAIIVEDEAIAARRLTRMLESKGLEILKVLTNVADLKEQLVNAHQPDLYFFDIHLSDGVVFEALEQNKPDTPIIFTTAYDQYAIKAFKQNSIDYLLKPIDSDDLDAAIEKYKKTKQSTVGIGNLTALLSNMTSSSAVEYRERISVKIGDKIKSLKIQDVLFIYSDNKINFLYTNEKRTYPIDYSIEELYKQLSPKVFFRVNRGYILNINAITEIISYSNSRLKIKVTEAPMHEIIVSREKVKEFKSWLG